MRFTNLLTSLLFCFCLILPSQAQEPAPVFEDLLSTVGLRDNGIFKLNSMYAYFMKADKGRIVVLRDGQEVAEFSFRCDVYKIPRYEILGYELVKGKNNDLGLVLDQPGRYELAFYTGEKKFYSFDFDLAIKTGGDVYNPTKLRLLNGDWSQYASLSKSSKEAHGKWEFKIFVRSDDGSLKQSKGQVRFTRDADKKLVAVGMSSYRREPSWTKQTMVLKKPGKKNANGEYYSNTDLLANSEPLKDGSYTLKFLQDGKVYGFYKFSVSGGVIQPQGRQIRGSDPLHFIEGGGKTHWIPKS